MLRILLTSLVSILLLSCSASEIKNEKNVDWAKGMVWYQLFPERFYNGDPGNDPSYKDVQGVENMPEWQVQPWTVDWYKLQPWEAQRSDKFYESVFFRMCGGDLQGVIDKLDYLQDLGIEGVYFNPLFESPSLHKYNGDSYHHIDDNFGPDPAGDKADLAKANETDDPKTWIWTSADSLFLELIQEMHRRDMRIVIDGVFNHLGDWSFAFKDVKKNQQKSIYKDWFDIEAWDDPATPQNEFKYKGWWGVQTLPELAEDSLGLVSGPREYVFASTQRWMDPNGDGDPSDGIDGWRLDVAEEVALPFWLEWNALVKSINSGAITVAEIWNDASEWIKSGAFDGTMNYQFSMAVQAFFIHQQKTIDNKTFAQKLQKLNNNYGPETSQILWNLMDSHDTDRLASMIVNPDRDYDRKAGPRDFPDYQVRKPNEQEYQVLKQIAAFQMTYSGAPMIYYGTEAGMWGGDDPDDRKPMLWPDMVYENEAHHPLEGKKRPDDLNKFDSDLYQFYAKLIQIRRENPVLQTGSIQIPDQTGNHSVMLFKRQDSKTAAFLLFNKSNQTETVKIDLAGEYQDAWTGQIIEAETSAQSISIPARGFRILLKQ